MKLGRKPRAHDPRIPKMSDLLKDLAPIPLPESIEYTHGMPENLGEYLNDQLGDCTAAAACHALQVWSYNAGKMVSPTDNDALKLYERACGYIPGDPATDQGGVEQTVLKYWEQNPVHGNELAAFIEIDPAKLDDVKRGIFESGVIYIGLDVPSYVMSELTGPGSTWDIDPNADNSIAGGHAVVLTGYDSVGNMTFISWGRTYRMTPAFWGKFVDEAYACVNRAFIEATGKTPAGLTITQLEALMGALKYVPPGSRRQHRRKKRQRAA